MKENILNFLKNSDTHVSGEDISKSLGVTRACVWKYIKSLQKDGYLIEGISKKGYKYVSSPLTLSECEIKSQSTSNILGKNVLFFEDIPSTNSYAKEIASKGAANGTLVISKTQHSGKGRLQREWTSPLGGLWFSLILRPNLSPINAGKIPLIAAASIFNSLNELGYDCKIKWPNDILLNDKKVCGILTEMNCELDKINYIILGIGLNANVSEINDELKDKATSLFLNSGKTHNLNTLVNSIIHNFEKLYKEFLETEEIPTSINICKENSSLIGKNIIISNFAGEEEVTCLDISPSGSLIVKNLLGEVKTVLSGEVSLNKNYK